MNISTSCNTEEPASNSFGDVYLPSINGNLFKEIAYSTYFNIEISGQLSEIHSLYLFIGSDYGLLFRQLQLTELDNMSIYLLIDTEEVIERLDKTLSSSGKKNILTASIEQWIEKLKDFDFSYYFEVNRIQIIRSLSVSRNMCSDYQSFEQKVKAEINELKWQYPDKLQRTVFKQNQLQNSIDNYNPAIRLKNLFQGKPVIILAGGPSLDNYIEWIEQHQTQYIVIAISRVARRLLKTHIRPDIFVSADPFASAYETSKEVLAFAEDSILISQNYAHPLIVSQWSGRHYYLGDLFPADSLYQVDNITAIGPTVTNCAIHIAIQLGMIKQVLLGFDLCYSPSGYSHVSSTIEHNKGVNLGFVGMLVKTNNNNYAETTYDMFHAVETVSLLAELIKKSGGEIINPNPDAAFIEYVLHKNLNDIEIPELASSATFSLDKLPDVTRNERLCHYSNVLNELKKLSTDNNTIREILHTIMTLSPRDDNPFEADNIDQLIAAERELAEYLAVIGLIACYGEAFFVFYRPPEVSIRIKQYYYNRGAYQYFFHLSKACDLFGNFINNAIERVKSRTLEEMDEVDTSILLQQWGADKDKQYGRISVLKKKNYKLYKQIHEAKREAYESSASDAFLMVEEHPVTNKQPVSFANVDNRLFTLFQQDERKKLQTMIEKLQTYQVEESQSLVHLAQGYLLELQGDIDSALNEYLDANLPQTKEAALKRVIDIALQAENIELVVVCLQTLAEISIDYLPQLAHLYQMSGRHKDALDTYLKYLESKPDDIIVLIKLGLLYLSLKVNDGAEFVFKSVLEIQADEQTALYYLQQCRSH